MEDRAPTGIPPHRPSSATDTLAPDALEATALAPRGSEHGATPAVLGAPDELAEADPLGDTSVSEAGARPAPKRSSTVVDRGQLVGRYVVVGTLGKGGMGVVHSAYDPELDRRVALKLLLPRSGMNGSEGHGRLLREAQAMAKLAHPNVVAVFDVGTIDDRVYVAMEFVDGVTMSTWLHERPRSRREVVEVFVAAGRGLAAAHEEGLVHRDFKPENVMIDRRGRVRVMDFGLVRAEAHVGTDDPSIFVTAEDPAPLSSQLTAVGAVMGTPAYMAPEQFGGGRTDARTDQFSFCVALWEALYGERPFAGDTIFELAASVSRGERREPPPGKRVPHRLRRAIERGLCVDAAKRHPSMAALLDVISDDPWRRRSTALVAAGGLVAAGAAVLLAQRDDPSPCSEEAELVELVWSVDRRTAVADAIEATELPFSARASDVATSTLSAWATEWARVHREACRATRIKGEQSETALDLQTGCLARARLDFEATRSVLERSNAQTVARVAEIVRRLPEPARCADVEALRRGLVVPSPEDAAAVEEIAVTLADVRARLAAGEIDDAWAAAQKAQTAVVDVQHAPTHAETSLVLAGVQRERASYEDAEAHARRAMEQAARVERSDLLSEATIELMTVLGIALDRHAEALALRELARGLVERPSPRLLLAITEAGILDGQGKHDDAEATLRAALVWAAEEFDPDDSRLFGVRDDLAIVLLGQGRYAEAEAELRHALVSRTEALGAGHPDTARIHNILASSLYYQGKYEEAEIEHRAALAIRERVFGPKHDLVAASHQGIANALRARGKLDLAEPEFRAAIAILEETVGPRHSDVAVVRNNLAATLASLGNLEAAEVEFRAALEIRVEALGPQHPEVARSHHNLGELAMMQKDFEAAEKSLSQAVEMRRVALGSDHPDLGRSLCVLAEARLERGDAAGAEAPARQAWGILQSSSAPPSLASTAAFVLARAIESSAAPEARALALQALALAEAAKSNKQRAEITAWLARHE